MRRRRQPIARRWLLLAPIFLTLSCAPPAAAPGTEPPPTSLSVDPQVASGAPAASARLPRAPQTAGSGCAIAPLSMTRVTKESAGPKREVYLRLLRSGQILFGDRADEPGSSPMFELREPGCVYITGHLFAEYFGRGDIWLRGEGRIKAQAPSSTDGRVPASDFEAIEFEGDRPELECARTLLPVLFFGTMRRTSPIASPAELDPASRCAESVPWPAAGAQP